MSERTPEENERREPLKARRKTTSKTVRLRATETEKLVDDLAFYFCPKRTPSGNILQDTPKRTCRRRSEEQMGGSSKKKKTSSPGQRAAPRSMTGAGPAGKATDEKPGSGTVANSENEPEVPKTPGSQQEIANGGLDSTVEIEGGEVQDSESASVTSVASATSEVSVASTAAGTSRKRRAQEPTGESPDPKIRADGQDLKGLLVGIFQSGAMKEAMKEVMKEVGDEVKSLDRRITSRMDRADKNIRDMEANLLRRHESATAKTNDAIRQVKIAQEQHEIRIDAKLDDLNKRHEQLATNVTVLSKRLNSTRDSMKVAVSASGSGGNNDASSRQVVVKGLNLKPIPIGAQGAEVKKLYAEDREVFITALKRLMPKVMEVERMQAGRGLSEATILECITTTNRLGREDARYPPLMLNFKCDRDAQLILSAADEYKEEFKERMKEYFKERNKARGGGDDAAEVDRPNVLWIDAPTTQAVRRALARLRSKAGEVNSLIRDGLAGDVPPVRVNRMRVSLMQEGRSEAETQRMIRSLGVDLEADTPSDRRGWTTHVRNSVGGGGPRLTSGIQGQNMRRDSARTTAGATSGGGDANAAGDSVAGMLGDVWQHAVSGMEGNGGGQMDQPNTAHRNQNAAPKGRVENQVYYPSSRRGRRGALAAGLMGANRYIQTGYSFGGGAGEYEEDYLF